MCRLTSCCCGCSLQTGSLLIGIWNTLTSLILMGLGIWISEELKKYHKQDITRAVTIANACFWALSAVFAIVLIIGAMKERPILLKIWLIFQKICLILIVITVISSIFTGGDVKAIVGSVINLALTVYFILVVESYQKDLTEPKESYQLGGPTENQNEPPTINKA